MMWIIIIQIRGEQEKGKICSLTVDSVKEKGHICFQFQLEAAFTVVCAFK